jgi:hypothetical protein
LKFKFRHEKHPCSSVWLQTNKQGQFIGISAHDLSVSKKLVGFGPDTIKTLNPLRRKAYDTLCSMRSLSATIAMNSLLVGLERAALIV